MSNGSSNDDWQAVDNWYVSERESDPLGDEGVAVLIRKYLAYSSQPDSESEASELLTRIREEAEQVVQVIAEAERRLSRRDGPYSERAYPLRFRLVSLARELNHPATLSFFQELFSRPLPSHAPEREGVLMTHVGKETKLRTEAIAGIGQFVEDPDDRAADLLYEALSIDSVSIQRAATRALLSSDLGREDELKERIAERIPEDRQFILDIDYPNTPEVVTPSENFPPASVTDLDISLPHEPSERDTSVSSPSEGSVDESDEGSEFGLGGPGGILGPGNEFPELDNLDIDELDF